MKWSSATFSSSITVRWKTDRVSSPPLTPGGGRPQPPYPLHPLDGAKASGISPQGLGKRPQLLFREGHRAGLQLFSGLEANVRSLLKGLTVWAVCILSPTDFKESALHLLCLTSTALCLIFVKLSKVFPASLRATWHLYRCWSHVLVSVVSDSATLWTVVHQAPLSVHGILQARILECFAICSSRGSSPLRDWTWVSCISGRFFTVWAIREALIGFLGCCY